MIRRTTAFISATYGSRVPKSVVRVINGNPPLQTQGPERSEGTYDAHNGNQSEYDGQGDGELEQSLLNPAARTERRLRSTEEARTLSPHLHEDDYYEKGWTPLS